MADNVRATIEGEGDQLADLHLWRLGPGHLGAIVSVITREARGPSYYRNRLAPFPAVASDHRGPTEQVAASLLREPFLPVGQNRVADQARAGCGGGPSG